MVLPGFFSFAEFYGEIPQGRSEIGWRTRHKSTAVFHPCDPHAVAFALLGYTGFLFTGPSFLRLGFLFTGRFPLFVSVLFSHFYCVGSSRLGSTRVHFGFIWSKCPDSFWGCSSSFSRHDVFIELDFLEWHRGFRTSDCLFVFFCSFLANIVQTFRSHWIVFSINVCVIYEGFFGGFGVFWFALAMLGLFLTPSSGISSRSAIVRQRNRFNGGWWDSPHQPQANGRCHSSFFFFSFSQRWSTPSS